MRFPAKFAEFVRLHILRNICERLLLIIFFFFFFYAVESKKRNAERLTSDMNVIPE